MGEIGTKIVERIANREDIDPLDFDVPLYEAVDADALNTLVNGGCNQQPQTPLHVEFTYRGYEIEVDGSGNVSIHE